MGDEDKAACFDLRDYLAAHAPEPPKWWMEQWKDYTSESLYSYAQHVAQWRWVYAEEMLKERDKQPTNCSLTMSQTVRQCRVTATTATVCMTMAMDTNITAHGRDAT